MNDNQLANFEILDCTIRDGGYMNNWNFDRKLVREVYRSLSNSGVDFVEIGFRGNEKYFNPSQYGLWRFSREEDIRDVTANIKGARLAIMADYGKIDLDDFCNARDSLIELVRVAVNKSNLKEAIILLEGIKNKGYKVSLNAMGYANYTKDECRHLLGMIKSAEIDYIYVADSYGSMFPNQIKSIFEPLMTLPNIKVGFHPHNNLQMAFANALEAIRCGVHAIDSTIYGMGRSAGNLPTEIIVSFLEKMERGRYNSVPVLNIIDRYFVKLQAESKWGYQLPYMLSGMFQCHPNYAKALVDLREYTIEDIRKAMEYITKQNPVGFSKPVIDNIITAGLIGGIGNTHNIGSSIGSELSDNHTIQKPEFQFVPYINRHKGKDFLVMANGPSLKEYRDEIVKFIEKYNPVILGANYLGGLFIPHYHAFNNKRRFISYVDTVSPESNLLIGQYISDGLIKEYTSREYETIYYVDRLNHEFDIKDGVIQVNCRTISVLLLATAIVMGANRVFCVGMDGYLGKDPASPLLFYDEKDEKEDKDMIMERHRWCQKFIEQIDEYLVSMGNEGIHILTPTSYKSFYKGIENYI